MTEVPDAILVANAKFYQALSLADAALMRGLWVKSNEATCVHPGWNKIVGYDNIQHSWSTIFVSQGPVHIWPSDENVRIQDQVAWVVCLENIDASATAANKILCVRARNGFLETLDGWKIIHHLAEASLGTEIQPTHQRLSLN
jgi:hypothetical protein